MWSQEPLPTFHPSISWLSARHPGEKLTRRQKNLIFWPENFRKCWISALWWSIRIFWWIFSNSWGSTLTYIKKWRGSHPHFGDLERVKVGSLFEKYIKTRVSRSKRFFRNFSLRYSESAPQITPTLAVWANLVEFYFFWEFFSQNCRKISKFL